MHKFLRRVYNDFNIKKQAEDLGVSVWQAPSFLFLMMGIVIAVAMTSIYFISFYYDSPEILILSESAVAIIIFVVGNSIIRGVEQIALANKMKSEFVSLASHQLKTPISQINWEMELLFSKHAKGLSKKQIEIIRVIEQSNGRMTRLVNDLLDVARIEQRRFILVREKVDVIKLIDDTVKDLKALAATNEVEVKVDKVKNIPEISGDRRRIKVVIDNLISNAIKYVMKKGKVVVKVRKKDDQILINIKDNGVGIPKSQQDRVFQKFFRSDNAVRYQTEGTGLGLYIAKNIIEQSGGEMWFTSREGVGSNFHFSLPIEAS